LLSRLCVDLCQLYLRGFGPLWIGSFVPAVLADGIVGAPRLVVALALPVVGTGAALFVHA